MPDITSEQVIQAARELTESGKEEFSRPELAAHLGVDKKEMRRAFKGVRQSGKLEKTRDDEENTGYFRLAGE